MYTPTPDIEDAVMDTLDPSVYHVALLVSLTICLVIFILLVTFAYLRYKHREDRRQRYMEESSQGRAMAEEGGMPGASTLSELIEQSSGSGSGLPLLVQRTIAKQIHMVSCEQCTKENQADSLHMFSRELFKCISDVFRGHT